MLPIFCCSSSSWSSADFNYDIMPHRSYPLFAEADPENEFGGGKFWLGRPGGHGCFTESAD